MNTTSLLLACSLLMPAQASDHLLVNSFESPEALAALRDNHTRLEPVAVHATDGKQALRVTFLDGEYPNVLMAAPRGRPWDWSGRGALTLDVTNPGSVAVTFGIRVDDDARADGANYCVQSEATVAPGETLRVALPLGGDADPMAYGMRGLPPVDPARRALTPSTAHALKLEHVIAWQVFLHRPSKPVTLVLDNVRAVPWRISLDGIVDAYGQYARADWPGKLKDAGEFAARRTAEQADLRARPALPDRDQYGGWTGAPPRQATGFFRAERIDGVWWLITPDGHRFFSIGMDCVNLGDATITTTRERMFTWLPPPGDPLARHAGRAGEVIRGPVRKGDIFNFFACNLERKFGPDYTAAYFDEALSRLRSWGFNTVGNWSDHRLYANGRVPYVATVHIGGDHAYVSSGTDYWGKMHDVFDPRFREHAAGAIGWVAARVKEDPWCVGWFVDNELSWGGWGDDAGRAGLGLGALAEGAGSPSKLALLKQLRAKYPHVSDLNRAWATDFASWAELDAPYRQPPEKLSDGMKADLIAFVREFARQYFRVVREELHKVAPHHLYLGCRFAWHTPEAIAAAEEFCDVVSCNLYQPRLDPDKFAAVKAVRTRPIIIGEFHFGALDRGMFHTGLVNASSQQARAEMYVDYLRSVADHSSFVGCHWFQYIDEPLTGRYFDGENYQIGFVNTTDTPYPEMVEAARKVHAEIYPRRMGQE